MKDLILKFAGLVDKIGSLLNLNSTAGSIALAMGFIILAIVLLIAWLGTALSSCSVIGTTGFNSIMVSSYFAEDEDIYAAEN